MNQIFMKSKIKSRCASCGKFFKNSPRYYNFHGNYCKVCCGIIEAKLIWKKYKKKMESGEELSERESANFVSADLFLKKKGINMAQRWNLEREWEENFYRVMSYPKKPRSLLTRGSWLR